VTALGAPARPKTNPTIPPSTPPQSPDPMDIIILRQKKAPAYACFGGKRKNVDIEWNHEGLLMGK